MTRVVHSVHPLPMVAAVQGITTIAALPAGAGCAASLPAEVHSEPRLLQDETQT